MSTESAIDLIKGAFEIGAKGLEFYNNYNIANNRPSALALETRYVNLRDKIYYGTINTLKTLGSSLVYGVKCGLSLAAAMGVGSLGIYGLSKAEILPSRYLKDFHDVPKSILKWSGLTVLAASAAKASYAAISYFSGKVSPAQPVLKKDLQNDVLDIIASTFNQQKVGGYLQNVLLYGPPGTGKTMLSKWISENSNLNYIMMSGGDLAQHIKQGTHVVEMKRILDQAKKSYGSTILFIDEAESICTNRDHIKRPEDLELFNAFLTETSEPSTKVMLILATNRWEVLDPAILSRMDYKLFIDLPASAERKQIIQETLPHFFGNEFSPLFTPEFIDLMTEKTDGLSGRSIFKMINQMGALKVGLSDQSLTSEILISSMDRFIARDKIAAVMTQS